MPLVIHIDRVEWRFTGKKPPIGGSVIPPHPSIEARYNEAVNTLDLYVDQAAEIHFNGRVLEPKQAGMFLQCSVSILPPFL